eukprot:15432820-Alexandrium_andersonii.AAC.1
MWGRASAVAAAKDSILKSFANTRASLEEAVNNAKQADVECESLAAQQPSIFESRVLTIRGRAECLRAVVASSAELAEYKRKVSVALDQGKADTSPANM